MSSLLQELERNILPFVNKPVRYIGSEFGLKRKPSGSVRLKVALVYPDLYEVGMSNIGLKALYCVAAGFEEVAVERAFAPWPDAEKLLRGHRIPLYSLETYTPLSEFDLVGITLQSELTYTNVLTVLDLAGIPLRANDRREGDPLICGGGPCAVNPEVMAPFFDFFVLGDGETALGEIISRLLSLSKEGCSRARLLDSLKTIEGVYVPGPEPPELGEKVTVLRVADFNNQVAPAGLPVPLTELAQHHFAVEIMRGCTCGCRFCQAGMYYRPVRVREVGKIVEVVLKGVLEGGWDSVTLLSLSSADYPAIEELVEHLLPELESRGVRLSFPSLRVDSSTLRLLERVEGAKKSGLTFAVEAGSDRLRAVIGKKVEEEDLIRLATEAFKAGWTLLKLYFMLGLPTETGEDVDQIARLIQRVADVGRTVPGRHNVNVSLSPFVPKPGTPFQWEAQEGPELIREKISRIRRQVRARSVVVKAHDPEASALEGVLARGDRRLAAVVQSAWEFGARFDGWTECLSPHLWKKAFNMQNLEPESFLAARQQNSPLPWHFVRTPVEESFLKSQSAGALKGENVVDCKDGPCSECGAERPQVCRKLRSVAQPGASSKPAQERLSRPGLPLVTQVTDRRLWRVRYAKQGILRFCGHLDMIRNIEFGLRRAGAPVIYSGGYSPRMRLHFSPPLPLGLESRAEYFDFESLPVSEHQLRQALDKAFQGFEGFAILDLQALAHGVLPQLANDIVCCRWSAEVPFGLVPEGEEWSDFLNRCRERRLGEGALLTRTDKKGRERKISLARALESVTVENFAQAALSFVLDLQGENAVRADFFIQYLLDFDNSGLSPCRIEKNEAYVRRGSRLGTPLDY